MRRNYPRKRKNILDSYDRVYVHAPEYADILKFIYPDRKVIYINTAAASTGNVIRLVQDREEL